MSKPDKSLEIVGELIQTAKIIGPEKTKQALIDARKNKQYLEKTVGDLIIKTLCKTFKISREKLLLSKSKGVRTDALMIGYIIAKKHLDYNLTDTASLFKKHFANVSKAITVYNRLDSNNKRDKHLIDTCEKISKMIEDFKNSSTWETEVATA